MAFQWFAFLCSCLFLSTWVIAKADAPGVHLIRQSSTDQINTMDQQLGRRVKWSHGAYFFMDTINGRPPIFYTLDRGGTLSSTALFKDPESQEFHSFATDRQKDGTIVFAGQTGNTPHEISPFLAWISADGQIQHMARTGNYFPHSLAVAPDDSIWTLGFDAVDLDDRHPDVDQQAHVLRHFDKKGRFLGSAFPQAEFDRYQRFRIHESMLVAARDRLGWYGPMFEPGSYTEVSLASMSRTEYPGTSSKSNAIHLAMTDNGIPSLSVRDLGLNARRNYVFNRGSSAWIPVSVPPMGGYQFPATLVGNDGDNLVFKTGREAGFFSVSQ